MINHGQSSTSITKVKNILNNFVFGGASGAIAKTITAPIEKVNLLLVNQQYNPKLLDRPYRGFVDGFVRYTKQEGFLSLWRGNLTNVLRYFSTQAINFSIKDALNVILLKGVNFKTNASLYFTLSVLSGGIAGSFGLVLVYPLDYPRVRLVINLKKAPQESQFFGKFNIFAKIFNIDGIKRFYQGFAVSLFGIFIYRGFYFGGYDVGKQYFWESDENHRNLSILHRFLFAYSIVLSSETLAYPIDIIRRKLMMERGMPFNQRNYKGMLDCGRKIINNEGVAGLFKGNFSGLLRGIRSLPPSITLVLYDVLQAYFTQKDID